jgi:menaquinone-specific isochorismate synthase
MAIGALPFRPDCPAEMFVPELAATATEHGAVVVTVTKGLGAGAEAMIAGVVADRRAETSSPPDAFRLESGRPHADFLERVALAVDEVRSGRLDKVVLAREVVIEANRPFRQGDLLERLRSLHPSCTTFFVDGFLGATPELLIRRQGEHLSSHPLAGTAPRSGDPEMDRRIEQELLGSEKERTEHRAVVDAIAGALTPVAATLEVPTVPEIVELRNVSHLGTKIVGTLARAPDGGLPSALELLAMIHPTPAVCGSPGDLALEYLDKAEDLDRDRYAGAVGWVRAGGDGEFHLGIRSATIDENRARLLAGVGIVRDSDPPAELRETQLKLQAVLAATVRP